MSSPAPRATPSIKAVAADFARAAATRDLDLMRRLFAPGAVWWHAMGDETKTVDESLEFSARSWAPSASCATPTAG